MSDRKIAAAIFLQVFEFVASLLGVAAALAHSVVHAARLAYRAAYARAEYTNA